MITQEELRAWCAQARTRPVPVSEAIDMLQKAADAMDSLENMLLEATMGEDV